MQKQRESVATLQHAAIKLCTYAMAELPASVAVCVCVSSWVLQGPQIVMSVSGSTWICRGPNSGPLRRVYVRMCMPFYNVNYKGFGRKTLGGPLGGTLGWTLGGTPWGTLGGALGGALADPWGTLGGPLEDPRRTFGGPLRTTAENIPLPSDIRAVKVCVHVHRPKERGMCTCGNCQGVYTRTCAQKRGMCKRTNCRVRAFVVQIRLRHDITISGATGGTTQYHDITISKYGVVS